jgi:hypothetical protein
MTNYWRLERDIDIVQGKTWTAKFRYLTKSCKGKSNVPVDLSGFGASMVIRECAKDSASLLTLTAGDGITLGADGTIEIEMTATQASNLTAGDNVYEIELVNGSDVIAFATGKAKVHEEIARTPTVPPPPPLPPTFNAVIVSGAVAGINGTYVFDGQESGKVKYVFSGVTINWNGSEWVFVETILGTLYSSSENVEFPWEVEVWEDVILSGTTPTLTPTNV